MRMRDGRAFHIRRAPEPLLRAADNVSARLHRERLHSALSASGGGAGGAAGGGERAGRLPEHIRGADADGGGTIKWLLRCRPQRHFLHCGLARRVSLPGLVQSHLEMQPSQSSGAEPVLLRRALRGGRKRVPRPPLRKKRRGGRHIELNPPAQREQRWGGNIIPLLLPWQAACVSAPSCNRSHPHHRHSGIFIPRQRNENIRNLPRQRAERRWENKRHWGFFHTLFSSASFNFPNFTTFLKFIIFYLF